MDPLTMASLVMGGLQTVSGIIGSIGAKGRQRKLLSQLQAYQTPEEVYQVLNATQQKASQGLDDQTLKMIDDRNNSAFASSLDVMRRIGGDPNAMSFIFGKRLEANTELGAMDSQQKLKNFSMYVDALGNLAANKAAEQKSRQDIIKDKLAAEGLNLNTANQNISGGINTAISALSSQKIMDLFKDKNTDDGFNFNTKPSITDTGVANFSPEDEIKRLALSVSKPNFNF